MPEPDSPNVQHRRLLLCACGVIQGAFRPQSGGRQERSAIGMLQAAQQLRCRALLDDAALVHQCHAIRHPLDDGKVVRHQDQSHVAAARKALQQRQHLRLSAHVQGGGRLIGDEQEGRQHHRNRYGHALPLSTGQFMGQAVERALRSAQSHHVECFSRQIH